jgi:predicted transcriptional regulator|tara:strand:+ start:400 stop:951 length:552 start_codon:yes stop_codon:yes gene_type:complete
MYDIFFQKKSKLLLLSLSKGTKKYVSEISIEIKTTYAHTFNLIKYMENDGIVKTKKKGRIKYVKLTSKGLQLADLIGKFDSILKTRSQKKKKKLVVNKSPINKISKTEEKLQRYSHSVNQIYNKIDTKLSQNELSKLARLTGRYHSLIKKLRPKDRRCKRMKKEILALIEANKIKLQDIRGNL